MYFIILRGCKRKTNKFWGLTKMLYKHCIIACYIYSGINANFNASCDYPVNVTLSCTFWYHATDSVHEFALENNTSRFQEGTNFSQIDSDFWFCGWYFVVFVAIQCSMSQYYCSTQVYFVLIFASTFISRLWNTNYSIVFGVWMSVY